MSDDKRARTIRNELEYMVSVRPDYYNWDLVRLDIEIEHLLDELSELEGERVSLSQIYSTA
jgi:hypothetical protein